MNASNDWGTLQSCNYILANKPVDNRFLSLALVQQRVNWKSARTQICGVGIYTWHIDACHFCNYDSQRLETGCFRNHNLHDAGVPFVSRRLVRSHIATRYWRHTQLYTA